MLPQIDQKFVAVELTLNAKEQALPALSAAVFYARSEQVRQDGQSHLPLNEYIQV